MQLLTDQSTASFHITLSSACPRPGLPEPTYRSDNRTCAALYPGAPVTPPPGWVPEPHRYRPGMAPRELACPSIGRALNSWLRLSAPRKISPPIRPKVRSRSSGLRIWLPSTDAAKPGAYV